MPVSPTSDDNTIFGNITGKPDSRYWCSRTVAKIHETHFDLEMNRRRAHSLFCIQWLRTRNRNLSQLRICRCGQIPGRTKLSTQRSLSGSTNKPTVWPCLLTRTTLAHVSKQVSETRLKMKQINERKFAKKLTNHNQDGEENLHKFPLNIPSYTTFHTGSTRSAYFSVLNQRNPFMTKMEHERTITLGHPCMDTAQPTTSETEISGNCKTSQNDMVFFEMVIFEQIVMEQMAQVKLKNFSENYFPATIFHISKIQKFIQKHCTYDTYQCTGPRGGKKHEYSQHDPPARHMSHYSFPSDHTTESESTPICSHGSLFEEAAYVSRSP